MIFSSPDPVTLMYIDEHARLFGEMVLVPSVPEGITGFGAGLMFLTMFFFYFVWYGEDLIRFIINQLYKVVDFIHSVLEE